MARASSLRLTSLAFCRDRPADPLLLLGFHTLAYDYDNIEAPT